MTEYDYSPGAMERFMANQARIAKWVDTTERHSHEFSNPTGPDPNLSRRPKTPSSKPSTKHRRRSFAVAPPPPPHMMHSDPYAAAAAGQIPMHHFPQQQPMHSYPQLPGPMPLPAGFPPAPLPLPRRTRSRSFHEHHPAHHHHRPSHSTQYEGYIHSPSFPKHSSAQSVTPSMSASQVGFPRQQMYPMNMFDSPPPSPLGTPNGPIIYPPNQMAMVPGTYPTYPYVAAQSPTAAPYGYRYPGVSSPYVYLQPQTAKPPVNVIYI